MKKIYSAKNRGRLIARDGIDFPQKNGKATKRKLDGIRPPSLMS